VTLPIEVHGLSVRYGTVTAVEDVTFALEGGRVYGLLGRNGAGKTSLLSVLAGFRRPSGGEALIGGLPIFENRTVTREVALLGAGGAPHDEDESVEETLATIAALRPNWDAGYAERLMTRLDVPRKGKVKELSRGKQSALGLVVGLAARCAVTLFDEPQLGMDAPTRQAFQDALLEELAERPRTVVLSTHLIDELSGLFEEVLILDRGRLLLQEDSDVLRGRGAAVTGPADAVDAFVGDLTVLHARTLGRTKSATVYGALDDGHRRRAREAGLDLNAIALQDLFVHLTEPTGGSR
jgi:ABC-2 type transport system ATP-binding protein